MLRTIYMREIIHFIVSSAPQITSPWAHFYVDILTGVKTHLNPIYTCQESTLEYIHLFYFGKGKPVHAIGRTDPTYFYYLGIYFACKGDMRQARDYYIRAVQWKLTFAMNKFGEYYMNINPARAKKMFLLAIRHGDFNCVQDLLYLYDSRMEYDDMVEVDLYPSVKRAVFTSPHHQHLFQYYESRKHLMKWGTCTRCSHHNQKLYPFDCFYAEHATCLTCYVTMTKCDICHFPKHSAVATSVL